VHQGEAEEGGLNPVVIGDAMLYLGDAREILPALQFDAVITGPPWDQATSIPGADDPRGLFASLAPDIARAKRAVVQLGCYTDPNFTAPLAERMPFCQVLQLRYGKSSYRGRVVVDMDVAYAFGQHIPSAPGQRVVPSGTLSTGRELGEIVRGHGRNRSSKERKRTTEAMEHPMPRHVKHVRWLVRWWSMDGEIVCDPLMGSGTTAVAAAGTGRKFVGIEIKPEFFELTCRRTEDAHRQQRLIA
jgi:hypothetical protein